jgi:nucleoside-diphosphate-sugar epimerase
MTTIKTIDLGNCLVTGGNGMLGFAIVKLLTDENIPVRVLDLVPFEGIVGVESSVGDICNPADVEKACSGIDTVFQTAAAVWDPATPAKVFEDVNIHGNKVVMDACLKSGVSRFIYTSSMDVVVDGEKPIVDGDESLPYPSKLPPDPYSHSKIIAEKAAIAANGKGGMLTVSLRPVGMYGPRDKYHLPNIIKVARSGMNIKLGNGSARFSHVYSENAAYAHILAAKHLIPGSPVAGQVYFITDHHPATNLFTFMEPFLERLNLPLPTISIPYKIAYLLTSISEIVNPRSKFNRFSVIQTCVDHTFVHTKAERDFGYSPVVSREEAFNRTIEWLVGSESNQFAGK